MHGFGQRRQYVLRDAGGSAVASDVIHREVSLLKAAGKPVIVSMGNYAASGGCATLLEIMRFQK